MLGSDELDARHRRLVAVARTQLEDAEIAALAILIAWPIFFVQFHELLFPPGTWTFAYTDSLIRLFPEQFWFDIGVLISVTTLVLGIFVALVGYFMSKRQQPVLAG